MTKLWTERSLNPKLINSPAYTVDALSVLCAQLTGDLLAIAKFLFDCTLNSCISYRIVFTGETLMKR